MGGGTRHNQPQPSELFSGWSSPQGPSCWPGATHQVSMKPGSPWKGPSPALPSGDRPCPNYCYQFQSSCVKLPPFPPMSLGASGPRFHTLLCDGGPSVPQCPHLDPKGWITQLPSSKP